MTQSLKQELKEKKIFVIEFIKLLFIAIPVVIGAIIWSITQQNTLASVKEEVKELKGWKQTHIDEVYFVRSSIEKQLSEIQMNLKFQMEKQGLKYQEITK